MAKGKKTGGRNFEPGNKHGKGQVPLPPELREVRKYGRAQIEEKLWSLISMTGKELAELIKSDPPIVDRIIANILLQAAENGDERRMNWFLDRTIGKVTQPISFESELKKASNEEVAAAGQKALQVLQLELHRASGGQNAKAL